MIQDKSHSIIVRKTITDGKYSEYDFRRSDIRNCKIRNCSFVDVDFSRSSLTYLDLSNCTFYHCQFKNVDLIACSFFDVTFTNCDFSLAEISDNIFSKCTIQGCNYAGSRSESNKYVNSKLLKIDLNGSVTRLNHFERTSIIDSIFGNCTISYNFIIDSPIVNTFLNVESLGTIWGIKKELMRNVRFLTLGRELTETGGELFNNIRNSIIDEKLCIELFVYDVSFNDDSILECMDTLIKSIDEKFDLDEQFSTHELTFLFEILKLLRKSHMLPFIVIQELINCIESNLKNERIPEKYLETLLIFYNNLFLLYNSMIKELEEINHGFGTNRETIIKIVFNKKPTQEICTAFREMFEYVNNKELTDSIKILHEQTGSYIVYLWMSLETLAAFNIGMFLLAGGIKHLIAVRAALSDLVSKELPKEYYLAVRKPDHSMKLPQRLLALINESSISGIPKSIKKLEKNGFNSKNIQKISEETDIKEKDQEDLTDKKSL